MKRLVIPNKPLPEDQIQLKDIPAHGIYTSQRGNKMWILRYFRDKGYYWSTMHASDTLRCSGTGLMDGELKKGYQAALEPLIQHAIEDSATVYHYDSLAEAYQDIADFCKRQGA